MHRLKENLSGLALVVAVSCFGAALTPSLMPRDPLVQATLAAVSASLGYEAFLAMRTLWRYLEIPEVPARFKPVWNGTAVFVSACILLYSLSRAASWQNATRESVGLPLLETAAPFFIFAAGSMIALSIWACFRGLGMLRRVFAAQLAILVPHRVGVVISFALVGWLFWALVDGALVRTAFRTADASLLAADILIEPDIAQPVDPMATGSSASLVRWDEMGRWGRHFVATAPTPGELSGFHDGPVLPPLRVYVGRRSAETAEERAELALQELIRVGGFKRSVLIVMVPTGTGWMDPGAHDTLDFMMGGDVATVSVQYSYLSSMLALLAHPAYGVDQSRALFDKIYDYWTELPPRSRPRLYVHGLSQGAFNSQASLPLLDLVGDPIQGALWTGSPFFSQYWTTVRDQRNPGSPAWRPEVGNGSLIRVMDQYGGLEGDYAPWGPARAVFLNYGSDPIVNFTFDSAIRPPAWLSAPRAPDVSEQLSWFPVVTMLQLALDAMFALDVPRFGHYYVAPDYIDAWAALIAPADWTPERSRQLKLLFENRTPAN